MGLIKFLFSLLFLAIIIACWPIALIIGIALGLLKLGMKRDFEP